MGAPGVGVEGTLLMPNHSADDFLATFDNAPLNRRYWTVFALMAAVFVFDFFDFVVVG